ncbi:hypothetical protein ACJX0J_014352 [Zea mays]
MINLWQNVIHTLFTIGPYTYVLIYDKIIIFMGFFLFFWDMKSARDRQRAPVQLTLWSLATMHLGLKFSDAKLLIFFLSRLETYFTAKIVIPYRLLKEYPILLPPLTFITGLFGLGSTMDSYFLLCFLEAILI